MIITKTAVSGKGEPYEVPFLLGDRFPLGPALGHLDRLADEPSELRPFGMRFLRRVPVDPCGVFDLARISYDPVRQVALWDGEPLQMGRHTSGETRIQVKSDGGGPTVWDTRTDVRDD